MITIYQKKYLKELRLNLNIDLHIQSIVHKKIPASISLEQRIENTEWNENDEFTDMALENLPRQSVGRAVNTSSSIITKNITITHK